MERVLLENGYALRKRPQSWLAGFAALAARVAGLRRNREKIMRRKQIRRQAPRHDRPGPWKAWRKPGKATPKAYASHLQATYLRRACGMRSYLARILLVFRSCFARVYPLVFACPPVEELAGARSFQCSPASHRRRGLGRYSNGVGLFRELVLGHPRIARLAECSATPRALTWPSRRSRGGYPCRGDRVCRGR